MTQAERLGLLGSGPGRRLPWRHPVRRQWLLLLVLLLAASALLAWSGALWRLNLALYDAALPRGPAPLDVAIVAIDDRSINAIGRWPWTRTLHARLIERLREAGVRGIAVDLIFAEPERAPVDADAEFATALAHPGNPPIVLPLILEADSASGRLREVPPVPQLAREASALGHVHLELDRDGIGRSVFLREGLGLPRWPHLALALLQSTLDAPAIELRGARHPELDRARGDAWIRDYQMLVPFRGPPGHFETHAYVDVLDGTMDAARLRGKWIFVGATAQGLGDAYPTPHSGERRNMPGVEISANVFEALRSETLIRPLGPLATTLLAMLPVLASLAGFLYLSPRRSLLLVSSAWLATAAASVLALRFLDIWWPPAAALAVLPLAYPLWSWRRLEASQRYLETEFARFAAERDPFGSPSGEAAIREAQELAAGLDAADPIERRIELVRAATARLRDLRRLLGDTLASTPDAIFVADARGQVVLANPAALRLVGQADATTLAPRALAATLGAALDDRSSGAVERALATVGLAIVEVRDRGGRELLLRRAPLHDSTGTAIGTIVDLADLGPLREAQRERDEAIRFLSHDVRAPASSLIALTQMQRDSARALAPAEFTRRVEQLAQRALGLAEGFVALSRAENVDRTGFVEFDLRDAIQDAVDEAWAAAELRHITIRVEAASTGVRGDRALLARAIGNLLGNAIKYSPDRSAVELRCRRDDGAHGDEQSASWLITVRDEGPGIPEDRRSDLFERFRRGLHAGSADPGGAGLGLALVRTVARRHGGEAGLLDSGPRGSTFFLRVPATAAGT